MFKISPEQEERLIILKEIFEAITYKKAAKETIEKFQDSVISETTIDDIVIFVDRLVHENYPMQDIKVGISRLLNVLRRTIDKQPYTKPEIDSFFGICIQNNNEAIRRLDEIRPLMRRLNDEGVNDSIRKEMIVLWEDMYQYISYYLIMENILFPLLEEKMPNHKCISVMWSIHDDVRRDIKELINKLGNANSELKELNRLIGDIYFNIYAVAFREERLLFPFIEKYIPKNQIEALWNESVESGFPYYNPDFKEEYKSTETDLPQNLINLKSGNMTAEQIVMVFNHLPVDITYVDENDKVLFFSTPKHRIFHRSNAVIGRDVHNCHPKESIHVVERIVSAFRSGKKDSASFWISMRNGQRVLIQYFAVRNEEGEYKGVLEVSQEISEIQKLEGNRRILDWED